MNEAEEEKQGYETNIQNLKDQVQDLQTQLEEYRQRGESESLPREEEQSGDETQPSEYSGELTSDEIDALLSEELGEESDDEQPEESTSTEYVTQPTQPIEKGVFWQFLIDLSQLSPLNPRFFVIPVTPSLLAI